MSMSNVKAVISHCTIFTNNVKVSNPEPHTSNTDTGLIQLLGDKRCKLHRHNANSKQESLKRVGF